MISWIGRRWDATGQIVEGGIYTASIVYDPNGRVVGLADQPSEPLVRQRVGRFSGLNAWWEEPASNVRSHDWSPDGTSIVIDTTQDELLIVDLATGRLSQLTDVLAREPVWSPDGMRIAFKIARPFCGLATISVTEPAATTAVEHHPNEYISVCAPLWSPDGNSLIYRKLSHPKQVESAAAVDVWQVTEDGTAPRNLTADIPALLSPVAWRE
jgi:Tol biopolymer transport system component